jgi:microcystin-dependent protein
MRSKQSYKLIGPDVPPVAGFTKFTGLSSGFQAFFVFFVVITSALLATYGPLIGWTTASWKTEVGNVRETLEIVNETLSSEIELVNTTLTVRITNEIMSINLGELNMTIGDQLVLINQTLCDKIMGVNTTLQEVIAITNSSTIVDSLSVLTAQVAASLVTINNVTGAPLGLENLLNIQLVASGAGIEVESDQMTHEIRLKNTGVATVNSVSSLTGSSDLLVTGAGMITVNSFPMTSTIQVDGSALSTALSNLQMQTNMQQMEIVSLNANITNIQTQINNIQMVGDMIAQDLNGTTITFNMTMMQLVMDVMTLQTTVITLQAQIDALNMSSVPVVPSGTITPFGGTVIPSGYLLCDGTQYLTTTYADLFNVIGTMYCPGPCTMGMFAVPDLRGKVPAGQGGTALSGTIGSSVGAETHTLSSAEMPTHTHTGTTDVQGIHTHPITLGQLFGGPTLLPSSNMFFPPTLSSNTDPAGAHSHNLNINSAGSGLPHNNIQPSLIIKYIIKT